MLDRYLCIHGHFYQPPRENPWLEAVEIQDSAYPCHDWNERITAECYAANGASRILDASGRIVQITNNYGCISFDVGPTLLSWMAEKAPDVHAMIQAADAESRSRFSGHGSAVAQAYNHMIMPLANARDKRTQVLWGLADFRLRFGRDPEGMWLPETAVDLETLDLLAEAGVKFTILSPYQAGRSRKMDEKEWTDATGGKIDPTRAHRQTLPSGRTIALFFYDGPISRAVAFEKLLSSGERFADRLMTAFTDREEPQLVHIATDGETYGHHHRHGDMALAYALRYIDNKEGVRLTNYGQFLELCPPTHEVEIVEDTSWSCVHGVGRWQRDCGCNSGGHDGWNQRWRGPLRDALDWLRDAVGPLYETRAADFVLDPWEARNDYIHVILDRSDRSADAFIERNCPRTLNTQQRIWLWELMELQRHAMLMYTSCGWFFDEISGIETVQVIAYAGRVIQLAGFAFGRAADGIEEEFLKRLALAKSNIPENRDGREIFEKFVRPAMLDLPQVAAHYAISSMFEAYESETQIFSYKINVKDYKNFEAGRARLIMGHADIVSVITGYSTHLGFAAIHWGDHNLNAGVRDFVGEDAYNAIVAELSDIFGRGDLPSLIRAMDHHFGAAHYTLKSLFRDAQRNALNRVLRGSVSDAEQAYRRVFENHAPLLRFLADIGMPAPSAFAVAAEFVYNNMLREALQADDVDVPRARTYLDQAKQRCVKLDVQGLSFTYKHHLEQITRELVKTPEDPQCLRRLRHATSLLRDLPFEVDLWSVQNRIFEMMREVHPEMSRRALTKTGREAAEWIEAFKDVGANVGINVGA